MYSVPCASRQIISSRSINSKQFFSFFFTSKYLTEPFLVLIVFEVGFNNVKNVAIVRVSVKQYWFDNFLESVTDSFDTDVDHFRANPLKCSSPLNRPRDSNHDIQKTIQCELFDEKLQSCSRQKYTGI